MKVGIVEQASGAVAVVHPASGFTVQEVLIRMGETGFEMEYVDLPTDDMLFNSWVIDAAGTGVMVDMTKAKLIVSTALMSGFDMAIDAIANPLAEAQDDSNTLLVNNLVNHRKSLRSAKTMKQLEIDACTTAAQLTALMP